MHSSVAPLIFCLFHHCSIDLLILLIHSSLVFCTWDQLHRLESGCQLLRIIPWLRKTSCWLSIIILWVDVNIYSVAFYNHIWRSTKQHLNFSLLLYGMFISFLETCILFPRVSKLVNYIPWTNIFVSTIMSKVNVMTNF